MDDPHPPDPCDCQVCIGQDVGKFHCGWCGMCHFKYLNDLQAHPESEYNFGHSPYESKYGGERWFCDNCFSNIFNRGKELFH